MRLSLEMVVIAIVILVVAVVVLAVFGSQILNIIPATDAKANCMNIGAASCRSIGELPPTWKTLELRYGNTMQTCDQITGITNCDPFGVTE